MQRKTLYETIIAAVIAALLLLPGLIGSGDGLRTAGDDGAPVPSMGFDEINRAGACIAVLTGSELYTAAMEHFPLATPVQYDTFADLFYALDSGKVDAALGFDTNIPLVRQSYPGLAVIPDVVAEYSYGFGTRKDAAGERFRREMNAWFRGLVESGRFQALLDKWNDGNGEQRMGDYAFTGERGTLRIATLGTWSSHVLLRRGCADGRVCGADERLLRGQRLQACIQRHALRLGDRRIERRRIRRRRR